MPTFASLVLVFSVALPGAKRREPGRVPFITALVCLAFLSGWATRLTGADLPAAPDRYFNDYASLVKPETAARLNARLADFERQTSNQIVVAIFPAIPADTDEFSFTTDVFRAWKPGQAGRDNGAILFVFVRDHKIWIQTGRGLEGPLPDAICKRITADVMAPAFKAGQYDAGLEAGVDAMIAATKGEFRGSGRTRAQDLAKAQGDQGSAGFGGIIFFLIVLFILFQLNRRRRGAGYRGGGGIWIFPGGGGGGWGGGGGGGSSGGDGGGFSGGGGGTSGGGSGSDW
ncbi:MAG TPA: TPM domain-containing protein [Chthoniobacterales bacterium]